MESVTIGEGNTPLTEFSTAWKLQGELAKTYTDEGSKQIKWHEAVASSRTIQRDGLAWLQGVFETPKELCPSIGGVQPNQTALVANLRGLNNGIAHVNGFNI